MALRWVESTVTWLLVDHRMWTAYDGDRPVGQVARVERDGDGWGGWYWGDLVGRLGVSLGHDPRRLRGEWPTADEAMQAVDERHARASAD